MHLTFRNAHEALPCMLDALFRTGVKRQSRNGEVLQITEPVILEYQRPQERVIFWPERDANPFFHFMESLWMLAGRNDLKFVANYASRMKDFSDDGKTLNGAYGFRWRNHFLFDQLEELADGLKTEQNCRRQVLSMWDANELGKSGKDFCCNTHAYFAINSEGALDLTVLNRSNDLIWGMLGANSVHFSVLLEYMACKIGVPIGRYFQISNNVHGYLTTIEPLRDLVSQQGLVSPYELGQVKPLPIEANDAFDNDIFNHLDDRHFSSYCHFLNTKPMMAAWDFHKSRDYDSAIATAQRIAAEDWRRACVEWLQRRRVKFSKQNDDGVRYE